MSSLNYPHTYLHPVPLLPASSLAPTTQHDSNLNRFPLPLPLPRPPPLRRRTPPSRPTSPTAARPASQHTDCTCGDCLPPPSRARFGASRCCRPSPPRQAATPPPPPGCWPCLPHRPCHLCWLCRVGPVGPREAWLGRQWAVSSLAAQRTICSRGCTALTPTCCRRRIRVAVG